MATSSRIARTVLLALAAATASGCLAGAPQSHVSQAQGDHGVCELTLQSTSFAGTCGQMVLHNTGAQTMHGWAIDFDVPGGGHLVNAWNALFTPTGSHVHVTPIAAEVDVKAGDAITIGYCASGAATGISLSAGLCDANGAAPPTTTAPAPAGGEAFDDTFPTVDTTRWSVADGTVGSCQLGVLGIGAENNTLSLQSGPVDGILRCAELTTLATYTGGEVSAELRAAPGALTTSMSEQGSTDAGTQGAGIELDGSAPQQISVAIWRDGTKSVQAVPVAFDVTADFHVYTVAWSAAAVTVRVDGAVVATLTAGLPAAAPAHITLATYAGTPAAGLGGSPAADAVVGSGAVRGLAYAP